MFMQLPVDGTKETIEMVTDTAGIDVRQRSAASRGSRTASHAFVDGIVVDAF
jgi:hypothetical protein